MTSIGRNVSEVDGARASKDSEKSKEINWRSHCGAAGRLEYITEIKSTDILCGRGHKIIQHQGNRDFRDLVSTRKAEYVKTGRYKVKDQIARQIVDEIASRNGRFLRKVSTLDEAKKLGVPKGVEAWVMAEDSVSLEKTKQALRDKDCFQTSSSFNHEQYSSTSHALPISLNLTKLPLYGPCVSTLHQGSGFCHAQTMLHPTTQNLEQIEQQQSLTSILLSQKPHPLQANLNDPGLLYLQFLQQQQIVMQQDQPRIGHGRVIESRHHQNTLLQPLLEKQLQVLKSQLYGTQLDLHQQYLELSKQAYGQDSTSFFHNQGDLVPQQRSISFPGCNVFSDNERPVFPNALRGFLQPASELEHKRPAGKLHRNKEKYKRVRKTS